MTNMLNSPINIILNWSRMLNYFVYKVQIHKKAKIAKLKTALHFYCKNKYLTCYLTNMTP
jgi:hypothetical protein